MLVVANHLERLAVDLETGLRGSRWSGLLGLADRVHALGGAISIASPAGQGTTLTFAMPISGR